VMGSLQHLNEPDALAMATYLRSLPQTSASPSLTTQERAPPAPQQMQNGERVYEQHCAQCHGAAGQGKAGAYAALAGTRKVLAPNAANLVQVVLWGGFGPSTKAHPRPYGMPPFVQILSQQEVADVLTFVRQSWGNQAGAVSAGDVQRYR
jgi:mono/diheme cytochrome c family protein